MLKRAAHGLYDVVYVLRFRDLAFPGWGVAHIVVQLGVPVTDVEGTTLNPADRVVRWLAAERARRSARITRALARKKAKGEWVGESRWGYQVGADGVHEEPDDHEQAAAQLARRLRQQGMSYRAIAREVTAAGYCSREGTPVTHFQVRRWLDRPYGDGGPPKPDDHRPDAPATEPGPHRG